MKKNLKKALTKMWVPIPTLTIPTGTLDIGDWVQWGLNTLLIIAGVIAIGFVIYGGILFMTSGGDSEKTTKARNTLLYSVLGVIVVVASYAIVNWAANFYQLNPTV